MSTTVTYKGSTLTTVNNATKTLKTAGKYMEGDVVLTDTTVDLSSDTVTSETLMQGYTAHDASGALINGGMELTDLTVTPLEESQDITPEVTKGDLIERREISGEYVGGNLSTEVNNQLGNVSFSATSLYFVGELTVVGKYVISETVYYEATTEITIDGSSTPGDRGWGVADVEFSYSGSTSADLRITGLLVRGTNNGVTQVKISGHNTSTNYYRYEISGWIETYKGERAAGFRSVYVEPIPEELTSAYQDEDGFVVIRSSESAAPQGSISITANGTYDVTDYAGAVVNVSGGGSGDSGNRSDPIRFFDYDGRLVASYASVPSAMPDVPTHDRLTNGTWNYTLTQVAEQFDAVGACDVGANYDTASGCTEIDITLDSDHLEPYLCVAVNGTVTVDWGDGGATDTITGTSWTSIKPTQHVYAAAGSYIISIDGDIAFYGDSNTSNSSVLRGHNTISGNRQYSREYCGCVTTIRITDGSRLGYCAFGNCYSLQSITIPSGVTSIGISAFHDCSSLQSVTIPSGVTRISSEAFNKCYSLQSITIPSGVTSIDSNAFNNCYSLQSITIPSGVTSIGANTFSYCYSLQSITIPSGVTSIGSNAFYNCHSLQSITIPSEVTSIGSNAFNNCYFLQSITIPSGVSSINSGMFFGCYSLQSITIPSGVTSIGSNAFYNCYSLQSITIPSGVTSIGSSAFSYCHSLQSITILSEVISINSSAFSYCDSLQSITIPSGVTGISASVFSNCYSLQSITIPSGVTSIGNSAFGYCYSLQSITIPSGVTSIGSSAFGYCYDVYEYHLEPATPPTLANTNAFSGIMAEAIIYVPQGCLEAYQTATNWSTYASYMQEEAN